MAGFTVRGHVLYEHTNICSEYIPCCHEINFIYHLFQNARKNNKTSKTGSAHARRAFEKSIGKHAELSEVCPIKTAGRRARVGVNAKCVRGLGRKI
jgi:hypothetical protein